MLVALGGVFLLSGCGDPFQGKPSARISDAVDVSVFDPRNEGDVVWELDRAQSKLVFVAVKPTAVREGSFEFRSGRVWMRDGQPVYLEVEVETASLRTDPIALQEHVLGEDFLDVARFPSAKLQARIDSGAGELDGVLELHGIRKRIRVPMTVTEQGPSRVRGRAEFLLPRHEFGVRYDGAADDLIRPEVLLRIELAFQAA